MKRNQIVTGMCAKRRGWGLGGDDDAREEEKGKEGKQDRRTVTSSPPVDQTRSSEAVDGPNAVEE